MKHVRSKSPTDSSSGEYDDIVGPVYETITTSGDSTRDTKVSGDSACDANISISENEAYESVHFTENEAYTHIHSKESKFTSL